MPTHDPVTVVAPLYFGTSILNFTLELFTESPILETERGVFGNNLMIFSFALLLYSNPRRIHAEVEGKKKVCTKRLDFRAERLEIAYHAAARFTIKNHEPQWLMWFRSVLRLADPRFDALTALA